MILSRKQNIKSRYNALASERGKWIEKNRFYYDDEIRYLRLLIPEGSRVLEVGCGTGHLLAALRPSYGVGVDISENMVDAAIRAYPDLTFLVGDIENPETVKGIEGPFDAIVISDTIGCLDDVETMLKSLHELTIPETRLVIGYYSSLWEPVLRLAEVFNAKMHVPEQNWLGAEDISSLCKLSDWDVVKSEWRQLIPKSMFGFGALVNRFIGTLPGVRRFCLRNYTVARPMRLFERQTSSVSVIIPCRNEEGHVEQAISRMPKLCDEMEIIFVEGNSQDNTWSAIQRVRASNPELRIVALRQDGKGKKDAVWKGFDEAKGELLMILDGDLTVPPESLTQFYDAYISGKGEFLMGSRMVYPVDHAAMRFLNYWANNAFALIFSWLLNQRITDTLCGTKVLRKADYKRIILDKGYLADLDPFGDFDMIFGASKLSLKIQEIPIRYAAREYGETQISRFRHGFMLLKMVAYAYKKFKIQ